MIKVKDGYAKLIGTTYQGSATQVLLSNGGDLEYSASSKASTLVQRNASQHIYATYFNSAISDEALTDIGSVYVRNTSDTFIRRVSKTQFYSILDNKFVTLDTTQSITGAKTFSTSVRFVSNASIIQNQNDTSNYTTILKWYKNGASRNTYDPSIGQHNTGGDGNGSICILPYPTATSPWGGTVGLFISKGVLKLDGKSVALAENYYTKTESDERYVNVTGDTMTGPLIVKAAITGTQLISTIATGTSPLKVTSTTVVTNLNSDLLDGLHETSFFRARGDQSIASSVPTTTELANNNNLCGSWNVKYTGASGHLVQFNTGSGNTRYMQFYSMYSGSLYWRNSTDSTLNIKSWKTIVDSANYTGIVLKIGTATKGSATLPIYLNAGTPTACSTTLGVSITGNAATATKLQTARTINGTSFNGTTNIVTAYWGTARTISLSGAVTGSASVNGSQNVTITTTYQFGSIDGRYVGGNKIANHGSSGKAYTADTYSSTFVNKAFVAFAERGSWAYANNGYVSTDTGVNIPLAGTAIFQWGASDTNKTQLYITPYNNSGVSNPAVNEMLFYTSNGSGYTSAWTRVLTHRNYTNYTVTKTGGGASGTWGISITGNAATATTAQYLASNSRMDYGWDGLNYFNINGTAGTAVKANNTPTTAWWHILRFNHANSSGYYTDLAVPFNANSLYYKRVAAGALANGKWVRILDELNYTSYVNPANFVTSLGTNGNYVTWTKNGTTNNLTVPFATTSNVLNNLGNRTAISGTTVGQGGLRLYEVYNNGYPVNFGNVLNIGGQGYGELLFQWTADSNPGHLYYRSKRDVASQAWSNWVTILDELNYTSYVNPANFVTSLGTNGNYVTWTKNGTTNNLTVPFATTSNVLNNLGNRTAISGTTVGQGGLRLYEVYNNGYPVNFGNVLNIGGQGYGELLFQWTADSNPGHLYYRSKRDVASQAWSNWVTILDNNNYSSTLDGRYVTLATNQTVSGIKTFSTQQKFTVATGTSPFTVSSTTVVSNLNADMLDGWHLNYILKDGYVTSGTAGLSSYWRKVWDITLNNQYNDVDINLLVHSAYNQQWGIISFRLRQNGTGTAKNISAYLAEVVGNIPTDRFRLYYNNSSGLCQLWCNPSSQYSVYNYRVLAKTWRTGTEATTLGTFYTGNTTTAQSLPSDSYVSMTGITIVNTAAKVANTLTFAAGAFAAKTYNGSAAVTVNIPTHTSHLTNNSGFWTGTRYWANIAVSTASSTSTQPTFNTCYTSNWFRSTGSTGWYSQTYGGGWYMTDSTWIRTYGSKSVYQNTGQIRTDGYLVTNGGITVGATSPNNGTYKSHVTGNSWSSGYIRAGAGFYHNSVNSNSYVLLAGGSYKSLAGFAKGNAGASNRGVYVTNGTVTAMTYYLNATVNSGASGKLAYYSGTNSIDDYTNTIGSSSTPIYINNGIPNAANGYKVVNSGHYFSAFGISGYIYVIRYGQVVCVSINMSSGGNGSTGTTTLLTNLPSAVYTTGQSASKGGGSALRQATFYVSRTTLYVYSYQADQLPNKVSFTYITNN